MLFQESDDIKIQGVTVTTSATPEPFASLLSSDSIVRTLRVEDIAFYRLDSPIHQFGSAYVEASSVSIH